MASVAWLFYQYCTPSSTQPNNQTVAYGKLYHSCDPTNQRKEGEKGRSWAIRYAHRGTNLCGTDGKSSTSSEPINSNFCCFTMSTKAGGKSKKDGGAASKRKRKEVRGSSSRDGLFSVLRDGGGSL